MTTEENYQAVKAGCTALRPYSDGRGLLEPYTASLLGEWQKTAIRQEGLTMFEAMVACSAKRAVADAGLHPGTQRVVLIVSTTKANVNDLADADNAMASAADNALASADNASAHADDNALADADIYSSSLVYPGESAERIARAVGVKTLPIVVCNACISGVAAIVLAQRLLEAGEYDHAIVCGGDCQGDFIISGFQSLKALSEKECRPFDMERTGLNLGEAAATLVLSARQTRAGQWAIVRGSVRNDAYHTTAPAKKGDGLLACLHDVLQGDDISRLAVVNAHGTGTLFNDQMESVAIERAGLSAVPVNALKGYYGHTMGAAGLLETILTMRSLDDNTILGTRGFEELGVSGRIHVSASHQSTDKHAFIKTISGFGGANAALLAVRVDEMGDRRMYRRKNMPELEVAHNVVITSGGVTLDGQTIDVQSRSLPMLTEMYKRLGCNYSKFYKMDPLSRLGFIASEILLAEERKDDDEDGQASGDETERAVILFNGTSSLVSDRKYLESIRPGDDYFPSPSVFVYTLPNIVTGEIAIRNGWHGETSFYILPVLNGALQDRIVNCSLRKKGMNSVLTGWLDYKSDDTFVAIMQIMKVKDRQKDAL